jgi:hypothetical protein
MSHEPRASPPSPAAVAAGGDERALRRVRGYLALLVVVFCLATALSLLYSLRNAGRVYEDLALFTARSFFRQVVVTRRWNARQAGVYVPVTSSLEPNPYLEDPQRDVVTTGGLRLTKVNPAYMTRLISEVMREDAGAQLHMTSLRPLRPENAADAWERAALEGFERGDQERGGVSGAGAAALFRYIAPLRTEESCLRCHSRQGYQLNDIRGGISVSFPYQPFAEALARHRRETYLVHLLFLVVGLGFILVPGHLLVRRVRDLQESARRIRRLEGLLPICAGCKKIRVASGDPGGQASWEPIERYLHDCTDAEFTHGMCPECARKYFGEFARP